MPKRIDDDIKYLLAYEDAPRPNSPEAEAGTLFPETEEPPAPTKEGWWPDLYDEQMMFFNDYHRYCLLHGERFSGKTRVCCEKMVRHTWENWNALGMMVAFNVSGATGGGFWEEIVTEVLPVWTENIGLQWIGPRMDAVSKNSYLKVGNAYGGWSTIMLKSIPSGSVIGTRFRNVTPSLIFFDELTQTNDPRYFTDLVQQIGRRKYIKHQQFIATCNPPPEGPDHWVYGKWFVEPKGEKEKKYWKENYASYHIPMMKNVKHEKLEEYKAMLENLCLDDPTAHARLIEGKWVKQLSGLGIFKNHWKPNLHIKGNLLEDKRLLATPDIPITVGYDLGKTNQGIVFMQNIWDKKRERTVWKILDEVVTIAQMIQLRVLVQMIMEKMNDLVERSAIYHSISKDQATRRFVFEGISDTSSWGFDPMSAQTEKENIEQLSALELQENSETYPFLAQPLTMQPAPKGDGSVGFRVRTLMDLLRSERIFIDSGCKNVIEMFAFITAVKDSIYQPARNSPYKHALDALTYPIHLYTLGEPNRNQKKSFVIH